MGNVPLLVFTICMQASIGIMLFVAVCKLFNKESVYKHALLFAAVLSVIGVISSLFHLARPMAALNALSQFGTSWLSREIWFSGIFTGLAVVSALLVYFKPQAMKAVTVLSWIAVITGLASVFSMAQLYMFSSIPVWDSFDTILEFYIATITMGAVLFYAFSHKEAVNMRLVLGVVVFLAVIVQVVGAISFYIAMGTSTSGAMQESLMLLNSMNIFVIFKWLCILVGAGLLLWPRVKEKGSFSLPAIVYSSMALIVIGQLTGRYIFFETLVKTGVGLV